MQDGNASAGRVPAPTAPSVETTTLKQRAARKDAILSRLTTIEDKMAGMALSMGVISDLLGRVARLELKDTPAPPAAVDPLDQM